LNELIRPTEFSACISLIITVFSGFIGGHLAAKIKYPPMLGMLVSGMMVRNIFPFLIVDIPHSWTSILWTFSLAAVVARAGLSLELGTLRKNANTLFLIGIIPILFEASWLSTLSHWLFRLPKAWSNLLAFGVASISPGVVVPLILNLKDNPKWIGSRLPPIMIASVSIDVLVATVGFGASLKYAFQNETKNELDMKSNSSNQGSLSFLLVVLEELALGLLLSLALGLVAFLLKHLTSYRLVSFSLMFLLSALTMGWVYFTFFILGRHAYIHWCC
jgi:Kef-type K+ transport system membrane component KefB